MSQMFTLVNGGKTFATGIFPSASAAVAWANKFAPAVYLEPLELLVDAPTRALVEDVGAFTWNQDTPVSVQKEVMQ